MLETTHVRLPMMGMVLLFVAPPSHLRSPGELVGPGIVLGLAASFLLSPLLSSFSSE
jgi:hypothetical protein